MKIEVEISDRLAERLDDPAAFAKAAVEDRVKAFDEGLNILEDWNENELEWASRNLYDHVDEIPHPKRVYTHLAVGATAPFPAEDFDISEDRARELRSQIAESRKFSQALHRVARDLERILPGR